MFKVRSGVGFTSHIAAGVAVLLLGFCFYACQTPQKKLAGYLAAGKRDLESKHYPQAIVRFKIAVSLAPKDADSHYYLGLAYWGSGNLGQAASELKTATDLNPKHLQARMKLAELAARFSTGNTLVETERQVQQILAQSPNEAGAWYTLALAEWRLGKPDDAMAYLKEALSKLPRHLESSVALATMQLERQDFAAAEKTILRAEELEPKSAETAVAVGRFYLAAGKPAQAGQYLRRALSLDPNNGPALLTLGETQIATGDTRQAEKTFAQLSALRDKAYKGVHASFLLQEKRYGEAIPELRRLVSQDPGNATFRSYLVAAYVGANQLAAAEQLLKNAVAQDAKDLNASLQLAELELRTRRLREAETGLASVLRHHSDLAQGHVLLAGVYEARHDVQGQQRELVEALRLSPNQVPVRVRLARSFLATDNAKWALSLLDEAPEPGKNSLDLLTERNWVLLALRQFPEARSEVDTGLKVSRTPELLLQDGLLKSEAKQYDAAIASFTEALHQDPEDLRILQSLARSYVQQNRIAEAEALISDYAVRYPKSPQLQVFVGGWMASTSRLDQAREAFLRAKTADPAYIAADLALARVAIMQQKWDEARRILTPLCSGETAATAHMLLADVDEQTGAKASAIEHYRKAIAEDPTNAVALNNIAYLLAEDAKHLDEALAYAKAALPLASSPSLHDTLGWIYYRKGEYKSAVGYLEQAVAAAGSAVYRYHLAIAYFKTGEAARGQTVLKAALAIDPKLPEARTALALQSEATVKMPPR
jgi:putative PEP-CTERM system TPR-repeat lipoprotein